jgi:predicted Zn-dependent peptidase
MIVPKQSTLTNGLQIVTVDMPEALSSSVCILVGVGSRYEQFDENGGVSHFLEHLLFKGTAKYPSARAVSEAIENVGGYNNAYTTDDLTNYYIKVPAGETELALDILCDMMTTAIIDPAEVDRERGVILEEINMRILDDPSGQASILLPPLIWPDHPLAHWTGGEKAVVEKLPASEVRRFYELYYHPGNMVVAVAGKAKHQEVVAMVEARMASVPAGKSPQASTVGPAISGDRTASLARDAAQGNLYMGSRATSYQDSDDAAAKVMTSILGRGMSSRLFTNVRERKGLAYSIYATLQNFTDTGVFEVYAGVTLERMDEAIAAIATELALMRSEKVTEAELSRVKSMTRGGLLMASESNSGLADRFGTQQLLWGKTETLEQTLERIEAVTASDILRVAGWILDPAALRMSVVAPDPGPAVKAFEKVIGEK